MLDYKQAVEQAAKDQNVENQLIEIILRCHGIDPDKDIGGQTAFEKLQAAIMGALDEIDDLT